MSHRTREQEIDEEIARLDKFCTEVWPIVEMSKKEEGGWSALSKYLEFKVVAGYETRFLQTTGDELLPYVRKQAELSGAKAVAAVVDKVCDAYRDAMKNIESMKNERSGIRENARGKRTRLIPNKDEQ